VLKSRIVLAAQVASAVAFERASNLRIVLAAQVACADAFGWLIVGLERDLRGASIRSLYRAQCRLKEPHN
jgi:hypothetical protein